MRKIPRGAQKNVLKPDVKSEKSLRPILATPRKHIFGIGLYTDTWAKLQDLRTKKFLQRSNGSTFSFPHFEKVGRGAEGGGEGRKGARDEKLSKDFFSSEKKEGWGTERRKRRRTKSELFFVFCSGFFSSFLHIFVSAGGKGRLWKEDERRISLFRGMAAAASVRGCKIGVKRGEAPKK